MTLLVAPTHEASSRLQTLLVFRILGLSRLRQRLSVPCIALEVFLLLLQGS